MGLYVTSKDGMGAVTEDSPGVFSTTGMTEGDYMHMATDFLTQAGVQELTDDDFEVTESGTPGQSVDVKAGTCYILNSAWAKNSGLARFWRVVSDDVETVTINPNVSGNPRIDIICVKVDTAVNPNDDASNVATVIAVEGTPAGSPTPPATPSDCLKIAEVAVANGFVTIVNANITDSRVEATLTGGISTYTLPIPIQEGGMINGKIDITVSANDLIVSLKNLAGNNPSAGDPVYARIGGVMRTISAALSVTLADGTDWFAAGSGGSQTNEIDIFVFLGYNATDGVTIGVARTPYGRRYADFNVTSTNFHYCKISTITNAAATDPYVVVARGAATLSAGAAFTWTVPTFTATNLLQYPIRYTRVLSYTPTMTAGSGSFTSASVTGKYQLEEKRLRQWLFPVITTNGTAATDLRITNVTSYMDAFFAGYGAQTDGNLGLNVNPALGAGSTNLRTVSGTYPGATGKSYGTFTEYPYIA